MPGVPSGKACDGCRRLKKKCDEKTPSCSRCIRLGLECIGSGQQRYKFQPHQTFANVRTRKAVSQTKGLSTTTTSQSNKVKNEADLITFFLRLPPSNKTTILTSQFIQAIKLTTNLKYNLAWAYGFFLFEIPRRMNENEALDTAVNALICAHSNFCAGSGVSVKTLSSYSRALRSLRNCLDDREKASTSETLCAVMLLLICQNLNGSEGRWSGHGEGAAKLLKARSFTKPRDNFEEQLLLSLRGSVLFEGLLNEKIELDPQEWISLVGNELDADFPEGKLMQHLAHVPNILRRARVATNANEVAILRDELKPAYAASQKLLLQLHKQWAEGRTLDPNSALKNTILHAYYQRAYGIGLLIVTILNWLLGALTPPLDAIGLIADSTNLVAQILELAQVANIYRPLGSGYVLVVLSAAWLAASNDSERVAVNMLLQDYRQDFPLRATDKFMIELKWVAEQLQYLPVGSA
ncbi:hypothetical protein TMatcc_006783 [Talaromyces marneffei ATCC 18224]|uniref:Putative transcriptional regulatory protein n=1 Tax=Talaromyces marneffei PM1 TaxID=1077442 RepID=A0A093V5V0_TALMA|nr:uncharacterized protein EYB26_003806 [Talaromyces marneffei]KAE8553763.1 hypothetical protein EYB25_005145 [Talaromyces marneffei]QGA16139.1 hypothetical protein EYB26_003806 [Talaromyces marneffei]